MHVVTESWVRNGPEWTVGVSLYARLLQFSLQGTGQALHGPSLWHLRVTLFSISVLPFYSEPKKPKKQGNWILLSPLQAIISTRQFQLTIMAILLSISWQHSAPFSKNFRWVHFFAIFDDVTMTIKPANVDRARISWWHHCNAHGHTCVRMSCVCLSVQYLNHSPTVQWMLSCFLVILYSTTHHQIVQCCTSGDLKNNLGQALYSYACQPVAVTRSP